MTSRLTVGGLELELASDPPNAGSQPEIDEERGLAVPYKIAAHVLDTIGVPAVAESVLGVVIGILGGSRARRRRESS